jgi:hypothetical protein
MDALAFTGRGSLGNHISEIDPGQPVAAGATTAPPPTKEEIEKMLAVAPRYGIEIKLPHP